MTDLSALVFEGQGLAVYAVVPLLVAGLGGSLVAGWLALRLGLSDPVAAGVLRGLAVLGALAFVAEDWAADATRLASHSWSQLGEVTTPER